MSTQQSNYSNNASTLLSGDYFVLILAGLIVALLFKYLWSSTPANTLRIRLNDGTYGEYTLNQQKSLRISGKVGDSIIEIDNGKVRFKQSPCNHQYCVHQGWLKTANQIAICLPNHISIELLGDKKPFDSLNY